MPVTFDIYRYNLHGWQRCSFGQGFSNYIKVVDPVTLTYIMWPWMTLAGGEHEVSQTHRVLSPLFYSLLNDVSASLFFH